MTIQSDTELLRQFGEALMEDFKKIIPRVTGRTQDSLRIEVDEEGNILTMFGEESLITLEEGRGPTQKSGPGDVIEGIKEWIRIKGFDLNPFAVAFNIHKYGNTLFRMIKGSGPINATVNPIGLKQVLTQSRLDSFSALLAENIAPKISSELLPSLKPAT